MTNIIDLFSKKKTNIEEKYTIMNDIVVCINKKGILSIGNVPQEKWADYSIIIDAKAMIRLIEHAACFKDEGLDPDKIDATVIIGNYADATRSRQIVIGHFS